MKTRIILLFYLLPIVVAAQNTMYFMDRMPQTISFNPAVVPNVKFYMALPGMSGISIDAYNSGFNYNGFKDFNDNIGSSGYNPDKFIKSIGDYNKFKGEMKINLFSMGFKLKDNQYFSIITSMHSTLSFKAKPDIVYQLIDLDNLSSNDFPLKTDEVNILSNSYISMGFAYSRKIDEHLTVGICPRINFNFMGIKAENVSYIVDAVNYGYGQVEYEKTLNGEVYVGLPMEINQNAIDGDEYDLDAGLLPSTWAEELKASDILRNKSLSIDLGATYDLNEWSFSASLLNFGASGWKSNAYYFNGTNEVIKYEEKKKIRVGIPAKLYLGAKRQFSTKWNYALMLNNTFYPGNHNTNATISLNGAVGKMLSTSVSYTAGYKFNNLGLGLRLRFFPGMDLFMVTDNVVSAFNYKKAYSVSAALGVNLSFGVKDKFAGTGDHEDSI